MRGWHCDLEVPLESKFHSSGFMRADAILRAKRHGPVVCAVEFKKYGWKSQPPSSWQREAYDSQGFPIFYCVGAHELFRVIEEIGVLMGYAVTDDDDDFWDAVEASYDKDELIYP